MIEKKLSQIDEQLTEYWLQKFVPQIVNYINAVVQFEELTSDELEKKRRNLILEFLDTSDSTILIY